MTAMVLLSAWMQSQVEFWKPVPGWVGYDVSQLGRARTWWERPKGYHGGKTPWRRRVLAQDPAILNPATDANGYRFLHLRTPDGKSHYPKVHRLVAQLFIPNPENKEQVNHKTGVKGDARADGLEWTTRKENMQHASKYLPPKLLPSGIVHHRATFTEQAIRDIRYLHDELGWSANRIAQLVRGKNTLVSKIVNRQTWKHLVNEENTNGRTSNITC
jgi:hypothetical protein